MTTRMPNPPDRPVPSRVVEAVKAGRAASASEDPARRMELAFRLSRELARLRAAALGAAGFTAGEIEAARKRRG